ncbi:hypothetical protein [Kribbella sp. NPDC006257]|uniref:hypothetical protein n=1 Tax=Kribbella sp. NPDC006257 TaxID=3156738 RepID=UPI0033AEF283
MAILSKGFHSTGRKTQRLNAALAHALDFRTWHSLCSQGGLTDDEVIHLMLITVPAALHDQRALPG